MSHRFSGSLYKPAALAGVIILLVVSALSSASACSIQIDPRINVYGPNVVYEDEPNTWRIELIDFAPPNTTIEILTRPPGVPLLPENYKNFPMDMGGEMTGATYSYSVRSRGRDPEGNMSLYVRDKLRGRITSWEQLPGRFPDSSGVPLVVDGTPIGGAADDSECGIYYEIVGNDMLESVEIIREKYIEPTQWVIEDQGVAWNMDKNNLGYNGEEEQIDNVAMEYTPNTVGDMRGGPVWAGSGASEREFIYQTPSAPEEYVMEVSIGTTLSMVGTWQWYEMKRTRRFVRGSDPVTGEETLLVLPGSVAEYVNELFELYMRNQGLVETDDMNADTRRSLISPRRQQVEDFIVGRFRDVAEFDGTPPSEIREAVDLCITVWIETGTINMGAVEYIHGPFTVDITGQAVKQSGTANSSVRPGIINVKVLDKTPPQYFHFKDSQTLYGTTGDLVSEWNDKREHFNYSLPANPENITVQVIENNPSHASSDLPFSVSFYYVTQLLDYHPIKGKYCGQKGYVHGDSCDCFPIYLEKFVWIKGGEIDNTSENVTVTKYDFNGYAMDGDTGEGGPTDPAYCVIEWEIPLTDLKEPLSPHFATTSETYNDPWGNRHPGWGRGGILKMMVHSMDGANLETPPGWKEGITYVEQGEYEGWEYSSGNLNDPVAAMDVLDPYLALSYNQEIVRINEEFLTPDFNVPESFIDDEFFDKGYFGRFGKIIVYDDDRPNVRINISDNSFLRRTFSFGNIWMGDFKREAFQKARRQRSRIYTLTNRDTLQKKDEISRRPFVAYIDGDPSGEPGEDPELWEFEFGDLPDGYKDQGGLIADEKFNPWFFDLFGSPYVSEYRLFDPADDNMYGYWVPEDLRLSFNFVMVPQEVMACDNINTYKTGDPNRGGIVTSFDPGSQTYETFVLVDGSDRMHNITTYNFRDLNRGQNVRRRECSVFVRVEDLAAAEVGGPLARELKVYFYVAGTDMKSYTIDRKHKHRGN